MTRISKVDPDFLKPYAKKHIWWEIPEEAVEFPRRVISQVMNPGVQEDMGSLAAAVGDDVLREAISEAEIGEFDERQWHYWHIRLGLCGRDKEPPTMPVRRVK
jgi:hypothetical protein